MANKKMTLQAWLGKEENLKIEFLSEELTLNRLIRFTSLLLSNGDNERIISEIQVIPPISEIGTIDNFPQVGTISIQLSETTFDQLKKNFRIFKFNRQNTKKNRIKKQIYLDRNLLKHLEKLTINNQLGTLENCLYDLVNNNQFDLKDEKRKNQQLTEELKLLQTQLNQTQQRIKVEQDKNKLLTQHYQESMNHLASYFGNDFFKFLSSQFHNLLKSELEQEAYEQISTLDLDALILDELQAVAISQLKIYISLFKGQLNESEAQLQL